MNAEEAIRQLAIDCLPGAAEGIVEVKMTHCPFCGEPLIEPLVAYLS